ncbi:hypothetical protein JL720_6205 [Aureococcus anophagefferens]|nr:hypothetical protein JL720_6205 [Aureococcus anophagefferens]
MHGRQGRALLPGRYGARATTVSSRCIRIAAASAAQRRRGHRLLREIHDRADLAEGPGPGRASRAGRPSARGSTSSAAAYAVVEPPRDQSREGCSGLSYSMDLCKTEDIVPEDHVELWEDDLKVVIDAKSMLYLFGLELGYSNELIGGGFKFNNPNAEESCGCGTSFGI